MSLTLETKLLLLHAAIVVSIALAAPKSQSNELFTIGARRVRSFGLTLSIFSTLVTESLFFFSVTLMAIYGPVAGLAVIAGPCLGLLVLSLLANRTHEYGVRFDTHCVSEYCVERWGPVVGRFARWVLLLLLGWVVLLQINLNGKLLTGILGWRLLPATYWAVCLVLFYIWVGGYWTVVKTDIFQSFLLCLMIFVPWVITRHPDIHVALLVPLRPLEIALLFGMSFAMTIMRPELWQRIYSASSGRKAARSLRVASLMYFVFCLLVFYYALAVVQATPDLKPVDAFVQGYKRVLPYPVSALFPVVLVAAMMSSLDSAVFLFGVSLSKEWNVLRANAKYSTKMIVLISLVAGGVISMTIFDSLAFAYKLNGIVALLSIPLVLSYRFAFSAREIGSSIGAGLLMYVWQIGAGRIDKNPSEAFFSALVGLCVLLVPVTRKLWRPLSSVAVSEGAPAPRGDTPDPTP